MDGFSHWYRKLSTQILKAITQSSLSFSVFLLDVLRRTRFCALLPLYRATDILFLWGVRKGVETKLNGVDDIICRWSSIGIFEDRDLMWRSLSTWKEDWSSRLISSFFLCSSLSFKILFILIPWFLSHFTYQSPQHHATSLSNHLLLLSYQLLQWYLHLRIMKRWSFIN